MQSIGRLAIALPARTRLISSTAGRYSLGLPSRHIRATKYVQILRKETHDTTWELLEQLHHPQRLALSEVLYKHGVTVDEFKSWRYVTHNSNIADASAALKDAGYATKDSGAGLKPVPTWLLLYLVCAKVRTADHAEVSMMDLVFSNLQATVPALKGSLLVLTMVNLVRFNLLLPMKQVVQAFLTTPLNKPELEFNLLLQVITSINPSSMEVGKQVLELLRAVEARQLRLSLETYTVLLRDRFVTLQLTRYLRDQMTRQGHKPTADQLEAYLKVFSRNGLIHDARRYSEAVRAEVFQHQASSLVPSPSKLADTLHSVETSMLRAQGDRASAFEYLVNLLHADQVHPPDSAGNKLLPARLRASPRSRRHSLLPWRKPVDVYDWTTAFAAAAKDPSTSWVALLRTFNRMKYASDSAFRPTLVTYTVLLRGLYARRQYVEAQRQWEEMLRAGIVPDAHALGVGLQILTRVGKPHDALAMLEAYASRINVKAAALYVKHRPIAVGIMEMNLFMVALNRIERPDIVSKLWDHMNELYGIQPNALTLCILMQAVRIANRLDDTLSGAVAHMALKNPFRKLKTPPTSRDDILASFRDLAGVPLEQVKPYVSGIWHSHPPFTMARKIFLQVMFGQSPELLRTVHCPAIAVRSSESFHPFQELTQGLGLPRAHPSKGTSPFALPPDLLTPEGRSHFPTIVPTNMVCFNYIMLLGTCDQHHEIPVVLAWMRALGIQPSKETLSVALVFWAEVSMQAPLIEQWTGGPQKSEYAKLVDWIEDWVGKGRVPKDVDLRKWFGIVLKINQASR